MERHNMTKKEKAAWKKYYKTGKYFVTCIYPCLKYDELWYGGKNPTRKRCWGWYNRLRDAIKAIEENYTDIYEDGYYPFAIIEKIPEGVCPLAPPDIQWFQWIGDIKTGGYKKCKKPKWSEGICNWAF